MAANTNSLDLEAGSSQTAAGADSAALSQTGNMSIVGWCNRESLSGGSAVVFFSKWNELGSQKSYQLRINATDFLQFRISTDGAADSTVTDDASAIGTTGTYFHIAAVYTAAAGQCEFYKNAVLISTKTGLVTSIFDGTGVPRIGSRGDGAGNPSEFYDGLADEIGVYSRALTGAEIAALYGTARLTTVSNLVGGWELNNDYLDVSGNGNTLTPINTPSFSSTVPFPNYKGSGGGNAMFFNLGNSIG